MPSAKDVLIALQSTLHIKNAKTNKMTEGSGMQTSQGFSSHYSTIDNTDKAADVPETEYGDRNYQTTVDLGLPSSMIGDGIIPFDQKENEKTHPVSKIFFAKEQSIPGLPPPSEETQRGIPPVLHGKIPGLPGLSDTPMAAPEAQQTPAPQPAVAEVPAQQPPPDSAPPQQAAPEVPPGGQDAGAMPPPGGDPNAMGGAPMGDPNAMAMSAPGAPVGIDPITGLPIRQPSEIGRIYELKKIYSRLTTIEAFLSDTTDQDLIEVRNVIAQAIEFFEIVTSNLQAYKDKLDEIIIMFYDFLDQAYSMMAEYFKDKKESFDKEQKNKK